MPLTLEQAETVAVGPFNPFIISPDWLVRTGILTEAEAEVRYKLIGEGAAFECQGVSWEVDLHRLAVSSLDRDCGALVAEVLNRLKHTPVHAVGNNFQFAATSTDGRAIPLPALEGKSPSAMAQVAAFEQTRWSGVCRQQDARVEITVVSDGDVLSVLTNFHRITDRTDYSKAVQAARKFSHDREASERLIGSLLNLEVKKT